MTDVRAREQRLGTWRSFRDVAHATRSLAASHTLRWSRLLADAERHLAWAAALQEWTRAAADGARPREEPALLVALGSDLGFCGRLNHEVAAATLRTLEQREVGRLIVVGRRLDALLPEAAPRELRAAPASIEAALDLADAVTAPLVLGPHAPLLLVTPVAARGRAPEVALLDRPPAELRGQGEAQRALRRSPRPVSNLAALVRQASRLVRHARVVHAVCQASAIEAAVRLASMTQAYETAERRIGEQERDLRKARQELITQEMLDRRR